MDQFKKRYLRTDVAIALIVLVATICSFFLVFLALRSNLLQQSINADYQHSYSINNGDLTTIAGNSETNQNEGDFATLYVQPEHFDSQNRMLTETFSIRLGYRLIRSLVNTKNREPIWTNHITKIPLCEQNPCNSPKITTITYPVIAHKYSNLVFRVGVSNSPGKSETMSFIASRISPQPTGIMIEKNGAYTVLINPIDLGGIISMSLYWNSSLYPNDKFYDYVYAALILPNGISSTIHNENVANQTSLSTIPKIDMTMLSPMTSDISGWNLRISAIDSPQNSSGYTLYSGSAIFDVEREDSSIKFVYIIACSPLIIIVILFHLGHKGGDGDDTSSYIVGIATSTLTILPLRIVLVPPEIVSLNRIDLILGTEIMLFLCLISSVYFERVVIPSPYP